MGVAISSPKELQAWLEDKPRDWAHVVALRASLRVLPLSCDPAAFSSPRVYPNLPFATFRAAAISSGARKIPPDNIAATRAAAAADDAAATIGATAVRAAVSAAAYAAFAATASAVSAAAVRAVDAAADAVSAASSALATFAADASTSSSAAADTSPFSSIDAYSAARSAVSTSFWAALSVDCTRLQDGTAPAELLARPLWIEFTDWFQNACVRAVQWLSHPEYGFAIWREWYFGRLEGLPHAFDRFDAAADEAFYRWIIEQDDDWWKRDPATVNADIAAKVEDLRRPAQPSDEELAQNPAVINFALDGEGRTVLAPEPLPNGLLNDPDARDTHGEILRLIGEARLSCDPGLTQATDMLGPVDLLGEAAGSSVADLRPRLFVLRGKELIRQFEERQRADSMASPLSVGQTNCFAPLIAAIMQLADEDPKLRKLWQGPDGGAPALSKVQITILVDALAAVGQTTPEAQQPLAIAAGQVRSDASPDDPARRTTSEMLRNVFRSIGKRIKWVDDKSQAAIGFLDRMQDLWERVRSILPGDELIARILDQFK
jgi:hypothetical protein